MMEEKLCVGQGARNRDSAEVDEFGGNDGVVLKTVGDDVCMDFLKPLETVAALQQFKDDVGF